MTNTIKNYYDSDHGRGDYDYDPGSEDFMEYESKGKYTVPCKKTGLFGVFLMKWPFSNGRDRE